MSKCRVLWEKNEEGEWKWQCTRFWMNRGVKFKESAETCYHYRCTKRAERYIPKQQVAVKKEEVEKPKICAWYRCDLPVAPNKLRHCSEVCRKRQNRWDYKQRQKAKKLGDTSPK